MRKSAIRLLPRAVQHRLLVLLVILTTLATPLFAPVAAQEVPELQIHSTAYIVIDADTGEIYAQRNAHDHRAMASLTKVFTATEALRRASLDRTIVTDDSDVYDDSSTRVGFGAGEVFSMRDLLYGMLLPSGNDAAHAIARDLGTEPGDTPEQGYERFIGWMNTRIARMGLVDTHLVNAHGWGVPDHYSTAYDIAAFMRYAIQNPDFLEIISTSSYTTANGYSFGNTNKLLNTDPDLIGGKTGYDDDAGYCLIEVAQRDGNTMISVTLDGIAPDDWYDDNRVLLNYAFDQKLANGGQGAGEIAVFIDPDLALLGTVSSSGDARGVEVSSAGIVSDTVAATPVQAGTVNDRPDATVGSTDTTRSGTTSTGIPGPGSGLLVAIIIAAGFVFLRARDLFAGTTRKTPTRDSAPVTPDSATDESPATPDRADSASDG